MLTVNIVRLGTCTFVSVTGSCYMRQYDASVLHRLFTDMRLHTQPV
jgi:hypothetical protein